MNEFSHKKVVEIAIKNMNIPPIKISSILNGCTAPDVDEIENGYAHHFYNPVTNTNYLGSEDSAKSRCIQHYAKYLMSGDYLELGRSIHFLEDICTPVHTQYEDASDAIIRGKLHLEFEKNLDEFLKSFKSKEFCFELNEFKSFEILVEFCALESAKNYYLYRDENQKQKSLENTAELAVRAVFNLLNCKPKKAEFVKCDGKNVGVFLNIDIPETATLSDNYRLRMNGEHEILIFKKSGIGRNFILKEVAEI